MEHLSENLMYITDKFLVWNGKSKLDLSLKEKNLFEMEEPREKFY